MTASIAPSRSRAAISWIWRVAVWIVLGVIVLVLVAAVAVPRLTGATPYAVLTGSMEPGYPPGTLVVVKPVAATDIAVGDVITYQLSSGRETVVTHRVVAAGAPTNGSGGRTFRTQGDANAIADEVAVRPVQVKGRVWYSVPYLGRVNDVVSSSQREVAVLLVAASLLAYAAFSAAGAVRDRATRRSINQPQEEVAR